MSVARPVVVTGQQIGAGWTPALSIAKALAALAEAKRSGAEAVYWMADEDHDRAEVATTLGLKHGRLQRHRFHFNAPEGTATGWLPWGDTQQRDAVSLWGAMPSPEQPNLRGHALKLGEPLWALGLRPFSPTNPLGRDPIQSELERWRSLNLEADLVRQADRLESSGVPLPLDPRQQSAWFSLNPTSGLRKKLELGEPCPKNHWLSPGAALRPLMQSLMLPVEAAVLGPSERAYWRLTEPLWERVGLPPPRIIARPSIFVLPKGSALERSDIESLQAGRWDAFMEGPLKLPSRHLPDIAPDIAWGAALGMRFTGELQRTRKRLERLDHRLMRDMTATRFQMDPEQLRQSLFPLGKPQERVVPGLFWLRDVALIHRILDFMDGKTDLILVEES